MKREFLKELGLEDEQIDKVMAENGKNVEKAKGDLSTKETELESIKEQLDQANAQIEEFKDLDVDSIKAKADEYKAKYEESQTKAKEEVEKIKFEHKLESALNVAKAKNITAVKALLDVDGLKLNGDEIVGLNEQIEKLKEENDYLFEADEPEGDTPPTFTRPGGDKGSTGKANPFSKETLNLTEQGRLFREDPDLALKLRASAQ